MGEPYSVTTLAKDAVALLDHLRIDQAHVLGYSLGGAVAQELAINRPERVQKVILAATLAQGRRAQVTPEMRKALQIDPEADLDAMVPDVSQIDIARLMPVITRMSFKNPIARWWLSAVSRRNSSMISLEGLQRQGLTAAQIDTIDRLHLIRAPALVIAGMKDRLVPPHSSEMIAGRIPGAELVMVKGASHALEIERAWQFNREVLRFLRAA